MESPRATLIELLEEYSLRRGTFTLASGRTSSYYIDARPTTMSASGLEAIGCLGLAAIRDAGWTPRFVGGLTLGADPVSYAIAVASLRSPPAIDAFTVRKQAKGHGTGRRIEGRFESGEPVVVVEDVITSGGSALQATEAAAESGATVLGVLAVVDRLEGGRERIEQAGHRVQTLVTIRDLGIEPESSSP